ncbi:alpha/beta hydrolase [Chitinophaga sp. CB10]|uniref:alpha/beta hydrolase n=1 Tax=Chitinophaga sp. CB10 TaxID=1891659 RepID=UPI000AE6C19F|nr:alpha/beta hydrolase [Chitinophaga sp. CB10]
MTTRLTVFFRQLLWLLLCQLPVTALFAQQYKGSWYGTLDARFQQLVLAFHVQETAPGVFTATMDSPNQKAFGLKMDTAFVANDSLYIKFAAANITYAAALVNDTALHGYFRQGMRIPLNMTHKPIAVAPPKRPQTPKPPFDYNVLDTTYFNADKSIRFGATLTYPKAHRRYPVILLITGSGQQDRDENLFDHKPFAIIADYLAKKGYAVLRVDDRGAGKSTGQFKDATSADFAKDVLAGVAFLKTLPMVDPKQIGLMGHSEGGCIAAMVASQSRDVAFVISLAGVGVNGKELMVQQGIDAGLAGGYLQPQDVEMTRKGLQIIQDIITTVPNAEEGLAKVRAAMSAYEEEFPDSVRKRYYAIADSLQRDQQLESVVKRHYEPWLHFLVSADFRDYWKKVRVPVLALNGSKDLQVADGPNLKAIRQAVESNGNKRVTTVSLPGLNHLFQHCKTCLVNEYADLEESLAPELLEQIGTWLANNVK